MYLLTTREFDGTNVDFYVESENSKEFWVTREHIGRLLGCFNRPETSIKKLHIMYHNQLINSFKEIEVNVRYKGICKTIVYNFDGLVKICELSGKKQAAGVVNFLWTVKREFEEKAKQDLSALPIIQNGLQLFDYNGFQVRAVEQNGDFWFIAKDVCDVLELTNAREAIKSLDDDEKSSVRISDGTSKLGGNPNFNVINESGIYTLIMRSNKPEAKRFRKWVTGKVLPTLFRTGFYSLTPKKQLTGKASDTKFYSTDELAAELKTTEYGIMRLVSDNDLQIYGFCNDADWQWYYTEEGREKIINAARLSI